MGYSSTKDVEVLKDNSPKLYITLCLK